MKNKQRGFIPLIAIIALGVSVIAGGVVTAIKIHDNKKEEVIINNESTVHEDTTEPTNKLEKTETINTNIAKEKITAESKENKNVEKKIVPSASLAIKIIDDFLLNQTPDSLKEFCNKAKEVNGTGKMVEVLNNDRTDYIKRIATLYEQIKICNSSKYENYTWVQYDKRYLITLKDNDSDKVRKDKITFNNRIKNLKEGTLIGYANYENPVMTPDQVLDNKLDQKIYPGEEDVFQSEYEFLLMRLSISLIVPEVELNGIKKDIQRSM